VDSDNEDYKADRLFVFDDRLRFSDTVKYQIESVLDYPFDRKTTFGASVAPSTLTAEKKIKPDGSHYVLIRTATSSEKRELFGSDEADSVDEETAPGRTINGSLVPNKLMGDLSDEDLRNLMLEIMHRATDIQEAAEAAFRKRGPSIEDATESWWRVFGARFRAAAGELPIRPLEETELNLAAERAQEKAESDFRAHCFLTWESSMGWKPKRSCEGRRAGGGKSSECGLRRCLAPTCGRYRMSLTRPIQRECAG
jgi:hypothetical protein